jgi:hypothetical protein
LTQALTLGLALASTSAFGRCNRIVMVFDVTHDVYHSLPETATLMEEYVETAQGQSSMRNPRGI